MINVECPWCAEPAVVDGSTVAEIACESCAISVEIAPDPVQQSLERAA